MDGLELRDRVLALRPDMKFLFMSGYAEHFPEQHPLSSEGCLFLEKPFLPEQLANKVASLIAGDVAA
jgi:CheY-like chemotaxis protein